MVFYQQDSDALFCDAMNQFDQFLRFLRVQSGCRLIEQQQPRMRRQRPRQFKSALQAVGQAASFLMGSSGQAGKLQQSHRLGARLSFLAPRRRQTEQVDPEVDIKMRMQTDQHVVEHTHVREKLEVLECAPNAKLADLARPAACDVLAQEFDAPPIRYHNTRQNIEQRGLASAVGSDQGVHVPGTQLDTDVVRRHDTTISLVEAGRAQHDALCVAGTGIFGNPFVSAKGQVRRLVQPGP